ncbi:hypothetical protein [Sanguibacter sp. 25GB23B1]|uniref:hypothetical protein n=1 Tax=unclassified Sanguibacter TaxID=2645534 RepID=UPI0032AED458
MLAPLVATVLAAGLVAGAPAVRAEGARPSSPCEGVLVVVDTAALPPAADGSAGVGSIGCAPSDPTTPGSADGLEALRDAGVRVDGTAQWGAAFVCRVDGRPGPSEEIVLPDGGVVRETCDRTPSAQAYWTLWTAAPGGAWTYAQTGAANLELEPGAALGLVFSLGTDSPEPPSVSAEDARDGIVGDGWTWRTGSPEDASEATAGTSADDRRTGASDDTVLAVVAVTLVVVMGLASVALARRRR